MRFFKVTSALILLLLLGMSVWVPLSNGASPPPYTRLISRTSEGSSGNQLSEDPSVAGNGLFVAFQSAASDLVVDDTNGAVDIFLLERTAGTQGMTRVSVASDGTEANGSSVNAAISPDGRFIVFESTATNLVPNDTNNVTDIFMHDRVAGTTIRVNLGPGGVQATGGNSTLPHVSSNGQKIAYVSSATNLVSGDGNSFQDVFVYTLATLTTVRVSAPSAPLTTVPNGPSGAPYITADGNFVVFSSAADNLVTGDNNDFCASFSCEDIFVRNMDTSQTTLVSLNSSGAQGDSASNTPSISDNGRYVVFDSLAENLVPDDTNSVQDVFLRDIQTGTTTRISKYGDGTEGSSPSNTPRISHDGNWVVFSTANDFVPTDIEGYTDIYRYSRASGGLQVASVPDGGGEANESSLDADLSNDGQRVVFWSEASNLTSDTDANGVRDVFIRTYLEDDATSTPTSTPTNTLVPSNTPTASTTPTVTRTPSPSVTGTVCNGCPPTFTPTAGTVVPTFTRTPTRTGTPGPDYVPGMYLPIIQKK